MIVTFVSECEKKALNKTRRVLDAFANRIGSRTWQTVITNEGLLAVKKLLRRTASKNTAVSCHWIRSRSRTELVWVVGNTRKFNHDGIVPVHRTQKDILHQNWEDNWHYLPLIKSLTTLAALFHDWGKSSELFQAKLDPKNSNQRKGDPLRHEWISAIFLHAYVGEDSDEQWLGRLINGEFDITAIRPKLDESAQDSLSDELPAPLDELPVAAGLLNWLILSHHRLPSPMRTECNEKGEDVRDLDDLFYKVEQSWGYENKYDIKEFEQQLPKCFSYPKGLPSDSKSWLKAVKKQAERLLNQLHRLRETVDNGTIRSILQHARLSLMLGDHYYSSLDPDDKRRLACRELELHANTDKDGNFKQTLDEHLLGVATQAQKIAHFLPVFEGKHLDDLTLDSWYVSDKNALRKKSTGAFLWQEIAVNKIAQWRKQQTKLDAHHFGFFAVNMASTGKGKTFANAKIMRALSFDEKRMRYILALGLRTLTLQTGGEYRDRIGLEDDELAILIGSKAVLNLYNRQHEEQAEGGEFYNGSESQEELLDNEIHFESPIPESDLKTLLRNKKDHKFLYAPVLSCTIDHLMSATETTRGGRYILPTLRLMSSDLVIDEIDDFDGKDLIAIGRLIHLAGMLGRKVMISSATIPPDLAEGYFNAYQAGWSIFSTMRQISPLIGCAWIDENTTKVESINCQQLELAVLSYQNEHKKFVGKRIDYLNKAMVKRKAEVITCDKPDLNDDDSKRQYYFHIIQNTIEKYHDAHYEKDTKSGKKVSFGAVRMANITPCVELTEFLLDAKWRDDIEVRIMTYHSRQVLLMRHEQEKHLDDVLKRDKDNTQAVFDKPLIRQHLGNIKKNNVIFIAIVSPVEEVGRDHDWDWSVIEPSSYRSFIQMAGRVLRHRDKSPESPNIALLQYNIKGYLGQRPAFCWPGYESADLLLSTYDLKQLLDMGSLQKKLDASARITKKTAPNPLSNLADLEHESIHRLLTSYDKQGPESLQGWLDSYWWLTAVPQLYVRFRESYPMLTMYLVPTDENDALFEKDKFGHLASNSSEEVRGITHQELLSEQARERLWIYRDYRSLLEGLNSEANSKYLATTYGELAVPINEKGETNAAFTYSSQLGLVKRRP